MRNSTSTRIIAEFSALPFAFVTLQETYKYIGVVSVVNSFCRYLPQLVFVIAAWSVIPIVAVTETHSVCSAYGSGHTSVVFRAITTTVIEELSVSVH